MTEHSQTPKNPSRRPRVGWCTCETEGQDVISMPDHVCPCGVEKHHEHCPACLRITQVG